MVSYKELYRESVDEFGFYSRIKGLPYYGEEGGIYTGYITFELSAVWFEVCGNDGNIFETEEEPEDRIDLSNAKFLRVDLTKCHNIDDILELILI